MVAFAVDPALSRVGVKMQRETWGRSHRVSCCEKQVTRQIVIDDVGEKYKCDKKCRSS